MVARRRPVAALPQGPPRLPGLGAGAHLAALRRRRRRRGAEAGRWTRPPGTATTWATRRSQRPAATSGCPTCGAGLSPLGFDCSGLVLHTWRRIGVVVARDAYAQAELAAPVSLDAVEAGDLYFFARPGRRVHHVGIVVRPGRMVHASETGGVLVEEDLTDERVATLVAAGPSADAVSVDRRTAPLLVLVGVVSVQFGGAFAATLVPRIGATGSVLLRLLLRDGHPSARSPAPRGAGAPVPTGCTVVPLRAGARGDEHVASTPRSPTCRSGWPSRSSSSDRSRSPRRSSRRPRDLVAVVAAALGVALVSGALRQRSWDRFDKVGIAFAAIAGAMWAAYIVLSQRTGRAFAGLDGLALALVVSTLAVMPLGLTTVDRWTWPRRRARARHRGALVGAAVLARARRAPSPRPARLRRPAQPRTGRRCTRGLRRARARCSRSDRSPAWSSSCLASAIVLGSQHRPESPDGALGPG